MTLFFPEIGTKFDCPAIFILTVYIATQSLVSVCNFGQDWEVATVTNTTVQYKAGLREEIKAEIGVNIGLRSVNITLKCKYIMILLPLLNTLALNNYNYYVTIFTMSRTIGRNKNKLLEY